MKKRNLKELLVNLLQSNHLLSVAGVLLHLEKDKRTFNKTSVYRAIDQLLEEEILCQHYFSGTEAYYELREHHHAHLVCKSCGSIATTLCDYEPPKKMGEFLADHHHTTIFGLCKNCQK